jgi:hypothetical protein
MNTINPGRHRRQKEKVYHYLDHGRAQKEAQQKSKARFEDVRRHEFSDRVRLIRQIKAIVGYPLLQYEDYEYISNVCFTQRFDEERLAKAFKYFDRSTPAADFDQLMVKFEMYWQLESWVNKLATMTDYFDYKGEWSNRHITTHDVFPDFQDPYWFDDQLVDMSSKNWREWKSHNGALKPAPIQDKNTSQEDGLKETVPEHFCWTEDMSCGASNPQPPKPKYGWDGVLPAFLEKYQHPRTETNKPSLWRRIVAALTNQKP